MTTKAIIPVLIGADLNCYNVARAFHEAYGVISEAFGRYEISATLASKIIRFHRVPMLDSDSVFLEEMNRFAQEHQNDDTLLILIGCTDDYANLIARSRDALGDRFVIPYNPQALMDEFQSKERFYCCCDKHGILYPKTVIVRDCTARSASDYTEEMLGFSYPIIVKPSNSVVYWKHPFDGMNKVYVSDSPARTKEILDTIFASGYDDSVILQDRIPGNDAGMYVLTAYCSRKAKVRMMCLGHVLLEEHTPKGRGNHAAIITEYKPEICEPIRAFLEDIGYVGYANFDIKYDPRDGTYRAFEINLRQGRSNYYVTAAGENIARYIVEDYTADNDTDSFHLCSNEILWTSVPRRIVYRYTGDKALTDRARALVREKKAHTSVWYAHDLRGNLRRFFYVAAAQFRHFKKYRIYCKDNDSQ
ncbi:MAG: ATP-grasp domain-containing protein [Clostridia bacterium]|nr:ATP-grasp domain-containing protein [Clostridia bacterium]